MSYDLALFDFDGTLADSIGWVTGAMRRLAVRLDLPQMAKADMDQYRDSSTAAILSGLGIPFWKMPRIAAEMRRMMAEEIDQIRLFPGIEAFVDRLRGQGMELGIVTSNAEGNVRRVLGPAMAERFAVFECGVSLLGKAPKLRRAARRAGVPVGRSVYVGDELRDLEAARKAGMPFAAASWDISRPDAFRARDPVAVFRDIDEMSGFLAAQAPGAR
jgi:phosphoglycolate phosphatase